MRFRSRRALLVSLLVGEFVCLVAGVLCFGGWQSRSLRDVTQNQVLRDNALIASQFAMLIEQMEIKELTLGSPDWERLQDAVEEIRLPNDGFVCITEDKNGVLLCHPKLRTDPKLTRVRAGKVPLNTGTAQRPIVQLVERDGEARGSSRMPDGMHLIAARSIPELGINVMVHQRQEGIEKSIGQLMRPLYVVGLVVSLAVVGVTAAVNLTIVQRYESRLEKANGLLESAVEQRTRALMKTRNATIFGLAKLAESRDADTGDHLERIRDYVVILAEALAVQDDTIDQSYIDDLALASSLHDIGKVGIPDAVLLKPERLTADERIIVERHAQIGGDCLAEIEQHLGDDDFLEMAREIAYSHHERWDGAGYPNKTKGDAIPLAARIVAVADVYDALTSKRPYKQPLDHEAAYDLILGASASQFDPTVIEAFKQKQEEFAARRSQVQPTAEEPPKEEAPAENANATV